MSPKINVILVVAEVDVFYFSAPIPPFFLLLITLPSLPSILWFSESTSHPLNYEGSSWNLHSAPTPTSPRLSQVVATWLKLSLVNCILFQEYFIPGTVE